MVLCIAVTVGFRNESQIGNAYGNSFPRNVVSIFFKLFSSKK
jgi:hypothetical protein